jgi:hypothetical protein
VTCGIHLALQEADSEPRVQVQVFVLGGFKERKAAKEQVIVVGSWAQTHCRPLKVNPEQLFQNISPQGEGAGVPPPTPITH